MRGVKHLIECHCVLPLYRHFEDLIFHKFVVFSTVSDDDIVEEKISQCNNCGVIHRVYDICKSEVMGGRDESFSLVTIDDIKESLPENFSSILEKNKCDISTWEHLEFAISNRLWGETFVLARETISGKTNVKILKLLSENSLKIESHVIKDFVESQ